MNQTDPEVNDEEKKEDGENEDGESKIDPTVLTNLKQLQDWHMRSSKVMIIQKLTITPKRLKKLNDDELIEIVLKGKELEKAMLNETKAIISESSRRVA